MPTSSKYIQLSSSVLMEYIYADQTQINVSGNEFRISTNTAPIWKMNNAHNNQPQIMNADSSEVIQDGLPIGTGNVRNRSFAIIEPYKTALLDIDKIVFYNDYDPKLTPSGSLPITFTSPQAPVYDTIRLHLVQGFNFEGNESLLLSVKAKRKDGSTFILGNLVYNKQDVWETLNPNSFFFGGRVYASYLEIRVLALYNLIYDYWLGTLTGDTVVERITDFNGVMRDQMISVFFSFANKKTVIDSQEYLNLIGTRAVDLPVRDQFETIGAYIAESASGDFVEYYATYSGNIIENYILDLNNSGGDYIILHDLNVFEYVYDPINMTYDWIKTDDLQTSQISDFDQPQYFRPIIRNTNTVAFKIDYVCRLYNRADNSQVWKTASVISQSASKYGRFLRMINLGSNPVQTKIYNQRVVKDISINRISEPVINNVRYITSLSSNANISITSETITPSPTTSTSSLVVEPEILQSNSGTSNLQVFDNGLARVLIPKSTVFLKFVMFQKINGQNSTMNLSGLGNLYLVFNSTANDTVEFQEYPNPYTSKTSGEVAFRLSSNEANKVLGLSDKSFQIFIQNESGDRTFLYTGQFYGVTEFEELQRTNRIFLLEKQIVELSSQIVNLSALSETQQSTIQNITLENSQLQSSLSQMTSGTVSNDAQASALIDQQSQTIANLQNQVNLLTQQITTLSQSLQTSMNSLAASNGLVQMNMKPQVSESNVATQNSLDKNLSNIKDTKATNQEPK
jgi:hypothetical protein